jgi:hypothetical protein
MQLSKVTGDLPPANALQYFVKAQTLQPDSKVGLPGSESCGDGQAGRNFF